MHAKLGQGEEAKLQNFHVSQFHVLREACETIWKKTRRSQWLLGTDWRGQARALNDWLLSLCFSKRSFCSFQNAETCGCCHSCSSPLRMRGQRLWAFPSTQGARLSLEASETARPGAQARPQLPSARGSKTRHSLGAAPVSGK